MAVSCFLAVVLHWIAAAVAVAKAKANNNIKIKK